MIGSKTFRPVWTALMSLFSSSRQLVFIAVIAGLTGLVGCSGEISAGEPTLLTVAESTSMWTVPARPGGGPQTPACGIFHISKTEVVAGQTFTVGDYKVNTFGISCDEVMGDAGLFSEFLRLDDGADLPSPWRFLEGAIGAPKFVAGPGVGFRVQQVSD